MPSWESAGHTISDMAHHDIALQSYVFCQRGPMRVGITWAFRRKHQKLVMLSLSSLELRKSAASRDIPACQANMLHPFRLLCITGLKINLNSGHTLFEIQSPTAALLLVVVVYLPLHHSVKIV